ncbi:H-type small acid-soluble spore protein [Ectobacillus ponti]|uniref:Small, acid-soluble spore protein H n=1 Tax=Ectobacillus ponti TaxID=2961894 RepID=A0AA41X9J2_9BACI|nr:H-type small acid-soluble spore protein [Ectobacillus ponti]MCP8969184.1 H-type small acid-soluble spore protein [Ectobacillus ponti]
MYTARAKEIAESGAHAVIMYEGQSVYIQHVDEQNGTARIFPLQNREQELTVPVSSLTEM